MSHYTPVVIVQLHSVNMPSVPVMSWEPCRNFSLYSTSARTNHFSSLFFCRPMMNYFQYDKGNYMLRAAK